MPGKTSKRNTNIRRAREKKAAKKAARRATKQQDPNPEGPALTMPPCSDITPAALLAFQARHFHDDSAPTDWFIDPRKACSLTYESEVLAHTRVPGAAGRQGDELGYYADGVRRTLTDAEIEFFRHSEREEAYRAARKQREEDAGDGRPGSDNKAHAWSAGDAVFEDDDGDAEIDASAAQHGDDELDYPRETRSAPPPPQKKVPRLRKKTRERNQKKRGPASGAARPNPDYEQYIDPETDDTGYTYRRRARELDEQKAEVVEMDY